MNSDKHKHQAKIVSFSGIDGAGKSTQIQNLKSSFEERGMRVEVIVFWDDIARLKMIRETTGHALFKGDKGVGSPSAPITRRDKNVRSFPMTMVRLFLYLVDAISTRMAVKRALRSENDLVIFDRFTYDELANLDLGNRVMRLYARLILGLVPRPHIGYILDADPVAARARKPEYPVDFLLFSRQSYLRLDKLAGSTTVVPALSVAEVKQIVLAKAMALFSGEARSAMERERVLESTAAAVSSAAGPS